ncbi:hypothetical protein ACROYT_G020885 [Oculina patagonica]
MRRVSFRLKWLSMHTWHNFDGKKSAEKLHEIQPCKDHGSNCSALAKSGQCQDRPQTVVRLCPKTCEACVEDW